MRKITSFFLVAIVLFFCIDRLFGFTIQILSEHTKSIEFNRVSFPIKEMEAQVVLMGTSRCECHYIPRIIEKQIDKDVYNAGIMGTKNIYYQYGLLSNILERYIPETIILELDPSYFIDTEWSRKEQVVPLAPYIGISKGCDDVLKEYGQFWYYKASWIYRYSGQLPKILFGYLFAEEKDENKGYYNPKNNVINPTSITIPEYNQPSDENRIEYFMKFISLCKEKEIQLIFTISPIYACKTESLYDYPIMLANENNIPIINHFNDTDFSNHHELFSDEIHLNQVGAEKYSGLIAEELKEMLIQKQ